MISRKANIFDFDWLSILLFILLVNIGIISIYSATYTGDEEILLKTFYGKQVVWFSFSFVLIIAVGLIPLKLIKANASLYYLIGIVMLILVLLIGANINGNKSWFRLGNFTLQPAEFAKLTTVLGLAKLMSDQSFTLSKLKYFFQAVLLIGTPALLILLQPDLGSTIVFASLFLVLYREGLHINFFLYSFLLVSLFILTIYFGQTIIIISTIIIFIIVNLFSKYFFKKWLFIKTGIVLVVSIITIFGTNFIFNKVLKPHQRNRIEIVLKKQKDDKGTGYNLKQALIAIGTGGMYGKGLLNGTQTQGDYIPEQHTDWVITVVGEQWGFVGTMTVVLLYTLLLIRLIILAERQKQKFSRIIGFGLVSILFIHYALNMLMVLGLFPTIGIPLPFLSYGGSSLWAFTLLLFIFLKFDAHRVEDW
jgi:rod shape determining protein RodA